MTRYEKIKSIGDEFFKLINAGLIPIHILDWKVYYEAYMSRCEKEKPNEAAETVAAHYDISIRTTYRIIKFMKEAA